MTFLFTDIVGSTRRWELDGETMSAALARHDEILASAVAAFHGRLVKHTGDGVLAVFPSAAGAVSAAVAGQRGLTNERWLGERLSARMGLHSGEALEVGGDYFGSTLNRTARLMAAGWGGQILCTQATVELARDLLTEGIGFRYLGEHLLRDLPHPIAIWQLTHIDMPTNFPPLRSLEGMKGNVPESLSSFIGRRRELAQLSTALDQGRVLTLTGVGGVGKTRLALELAADAQHGHPDGVWWCELAPIGDPQAVVGVVAGAFGLVREPNRPLVDTLASYLGSKTAVLVLDNCEHLLDEVAELVELLCRRCEALRVLATSREPLGVEGEITEAVRPLDEEEAVGLFVDRARAVRPAFVVDDATREICRRLDGIPLALEMAAARLRSMQTREIAARLDERLRLLVGARRAVPRHQTLRATVLWSHDMLDERERRVFRRLAVFAGSFSLDAAEAVVADEQLDVIDVDGLLGSLVAKSLVVADAGPEGATRYRLLETIRQFAHEQLDLARESDDRHRRHADHYASFVAGAAGGLRGADEPLWADRVAIELDNLRAASSWAVAAGDPALALALFAPLPPSGLTLPTTFEIFTWIDAALAVPGAVEDPSFWPTLTWLFQRCINLFEWDQIAARRQWVSSLPGAEDHPETHMVYGHFFQGVETDPGGAAAVHERAAQLYAAQGDQYNEVRNRSISLVYGGSLGVDARAWAAMEANAEQARRLCNPFITAFGLGFVVSGQPNYVLSDPARALQLLDEAAPWASRCRNPFMAKAIGAARVLALAHLGDVTALSAARDTIEASVNRLQVGLQVGVLSIAFSQMGHHLAAAELIGAVSAAVTTYNTFRSAQLVSDAWEATRAALGDAQYRAAVARGAARTYEELVDWLRDALDRLVVDTPS